MTDSAAADGAPAPTLNRAFASAEQGLVEASERDGRPAPGTPEPDDDGAE